MKTTSKYQKVVPMVIGIFNALLLLSVPAFAQHMGIDNANVAVSPGTYMKTLGNVALKNSGTIIDNSGTITLQGDWVNSGKGLINNSPGTVELNGTAIQNFAGDSTTVFNNLHLLNAAGARFRYHEDVNGQLVISGPVLLNNWTLTLGENAPPIMADAGSLGSGKMLICNNGVTGGQVRKMMNAPGSYTFPVGDNTGTAEYSPITVSLTSGTFGDTANIAVKVINTKHPNNHSNVNYLNRFWHVTQSDISSFTGNITGSYVVADVTGVESSLSTGKWNGYFPWQVLNNVNTATHTISGTINSLSDFTGIDGDANDFIPLEANCTVITNASCKNAADGSAKAAATGGTWPYTYKWNTSPVQTTETAIGLKAGAYTITVTDVEGVTTICSIIITEPVLACPVVSFTLVNSNSDTDIRQLNSNDTINLFCLSKINIRANVNFPVASVRFMLNGNTVRIENAAPYALAGDNSSGNYYDWNVSPGFYTLIATPYTGANVSGTAGQPLTANLLIVNQPCNDNDACTDDVCINNKCAFLATDCDDSDNCTTESCDSQSGCIYAPVPDCCHIDADCDDGDNCTIDECKTVSCFYTNADATEVTSFTLVNSSTDADIGPIGNGSVIYLGLTPNVNIRANLCDNTGVGSVKFNLNGHQFKIENTAPYALAGDASGNYSKWNVSPGSYTINAIPYSGANATGTAGTGKTISITVMGGTAKTDSEATIYEAKETSLNAYPNPFSDKLNIKFSLVENSRAKLEIFSVSGQRLATLFEGDVKAGELQQFEYAPAVNCGCMVIYRLQTEHGTHYGKAVMIN